MESQMRAVAAIEKGNFKDEIVPYEIKTRKGQSSLIMENIHSSGRRLKNLG